MVLRYAFLLARWVFLLFPIMYFTKCITYFVVLSSTFSRKSRGDFTVGLGSSKSVSLITHEPIINRVSTVCFLI